MYTSTEQVNNDGENVRQDIQKRKPAPSPATERDDRWPTVLLEQIIVALRARVPLVVEVLLGVAPALALAMQVALRTVLEGIVLVACYARESQTRIVRRWRKATHQFL